MPDGSTQVEVDIPPGSKLLERSDGKGNSMITLLMNGESRVVGKTGSPPEGWEEKKTEKKNEMGSATVRQES
jgi:hypothetical protein